ncbi:FAD-dependent oxidoreductase [Actinophytocola oryzae]|uniref:2-polyprenyl-6-methoxyphenol hydroxylase-like FAD-dependent oxidoreductase n=1 Tax=Actinophytocola oryzae TaxID=502181 RepID=A0A4R7W3E3_9PSEU|nr:FAD-dependent monooxygenase [Actinophytocola oryzae]TDV57163.1 2-polyprenyl-6-methoxyphenol hydroxylase-like FAD-dependent oxidoreductase [Actinophytocola oryzae]
MSRVRNALVIGGGVAGPVTAMALHKAGIEATVYEAYPSTADGVGGSLALAPNGQAALEVVGALDAVRATGLPIPKQVMSFGGREVELPRLSGLPPLLLVQRADLYRALYDVAVETGVRFEHGRRLTAIDGTTVRFADGTTATADVVIGADGVHSTVRGLIDPAAPGPRYTGMLGLESIVDHPVPTGTGTMYFSFGKRAYYLFWRRPDGTTHFGANLPQERPMTLREARTVRATDWLARLAAAYGDDEPGGPLVRHIDPAKLTVTGALHIMPPVPRWHRGHVVLVGDAVHAPSNTSGQGASLAIESAVELARCLRDLPDAASAFAAYERMRRPRVEGIAARAAKVNHMKAPGPVMKAVMPVMMRLLLKTAMRPEKAFGHEQRYRVDWSAPVGGAVSATP